MGVPVTMDDPVGLVSSQLRSRGIVLPRDNEWLNGCVECFVSTYPNQTPKQLFDFVFEQWTLADLQDVGAPSLPPSCVDCTKMVLTGKYAVQINYFLNVGVPLHKQLQKIRRPAATTNLEVDNERQERDRDKLKEDASRALKMEITDGVTTIIGFEDQPIPAIQAKALPGEKALLVGPIEVRKGVLLLKAGNVTMLGGEVDTLLIKNAPENILARALGQEENPDPYGVASGNPALRSLASQIQAPSVAALQAPTAPSIPQRAPPALAPPIRQAPTTNAFHDPFDDGEDEALASLAEALENDSFDLTESPVSNRPTNNPRPNPIPANRPNAATPRTNTSSKNTTKPSKATSSQKPTKQPTITAFLSQPKKASYDVSCELEDDMFDDDFELMAARTASWAEEQAKNQSNHDPEKLKKQLEATYSRTTNVAASTASMASAERSNPVQSTVRSTNPESKQPNKRKDTAVERDIFGRPKIPRTESSGPSSTSSEAQPFKNPRHAEPQDELMDSEELHDWLPPPPKANLDHVRPSHEKGKILIDYTDPSTLNLDLVSTQKKPETSKPEPKSALPLEEPFPPKEFPCTRTTFGRVVKVVNKLQLRDAKWVLSAVVEAKGIELEMDFSPEALDKIFTVSAEEITRQKEQLKKNPELKEKFNAQLRESQKRIQTLNCKMTIHFKNFISKPVVLDVSKDD